MPESPQETTGVLANRVWRVEQRQNDILVHLEKIDDKLEKIIHAQSERMWKVSELEDRIEKIERKAAPLSPLGDSTIVRWIVATLLATVVALATGQFLNLTGLLK